MLPKSWNRRLVDMNVRPLATADLEWADLVFASAMYVQKQSLKEVISLCKAEGKTVVMGGPYASMVSTMRLRPITFSSAKSRRPFRSSWKILSVAKQKLFTRLQSDRRLP